jgi:hypothetical protein
MTWNYVMGIVSTVALSLPILTIIATKLHGYRSFPVLLLYYAIAVGDNFLTQGYIHADKAFIRYYGIANNLLEAPLILIFLTYFSTSVQLARKMKILIAAFIGYEAIIVSIFGFTRNAITITIGFGLLLILSFCVIFFTRQTKITIMHRKATGKALIAASFLFSFGCYSIIYLMYYIFKTPKADTFLVYFLVTTFSSVLICAGIVIERKRVQKLNELKQTRKELSIVYKENTPTVPIKKISLDFDQEQWN